MAVLRTYRMEGSEQASGSGWQMAVHPDDLKRVTETMERVADDW
jgi:hypothetical protein